MGATSSCYFRETILGLSRPSGQFKFYLPSPLVVVFCVFVNNSLVVYKREERGDGSGALLSDPSEEVLLHPVPGFSGFLWCVF